MLKKFKILWGKVPEIVKIFLVVSLIFSVIILGACGTFFWKNYPQDNFVEELIEDMIKEKSGLDLDLSPNSKETITSLPTFL